MTTYWTIVVRDRGQDRLRQPTPNGETPYKFVNLSAANRLANNMRNRKLWASVFTLPCDEHGKILPGYLTGADLPTIGRHA